MKRIIAALCMALAACQPSESEQAANEAAKQPVDELGYPTRQPNGSTLTAAFCATEEADKIYDNIKTCSMVACGQRDEESCKIAATFATQHAPTDPTDPYAGAVLSSCRQGGCSWEKVLNVRTVKSLPNGTLKIEQTYQGSSDHQSSPYPDHYSPSIGIRWEKTPVQTYVFCSRTQPSIAFKDRWEGGTGKWYGHLLDLYETAGYNTPSAKTYMRVCHGVEFNRADIEQVLAKLGYRRGTRNEQVVLEVPTQLPNPPPPELEETGNN